MASCSARSAGRAGKRTWAGRRRTNFGASTAWLAAVASRDRGAVVVWAVAPLFAAAILLGVLFFFAHRAGRRAVNDLDFKLEHPPSAAVQVVAPPPAADVELAAP